MPGFAVYYKDPNRQLVTYGQFIKASSSVCKFTAAHNCFLADVVPIFHNCFFRGLPCYFLTLHKIMLYTDHFHISLFIADSYTANGVQKSQDH
jgi:hypothetical protein